MGSAVSVSSVSSSSAVASDLVAEDREDREDRVRDRLHHRLASPIPLSVASLVKQVSPCNQWNSRLGACSRPSD